MGNASPHSLVASGTDNSNATVEAIAAVAGYQIGLNTIMVNSDAEETIAVKFGATQKFRLYLGAKSNGGRDYAKTRWLPVNTALNLTKLVDSTDEISYEIDYELRKVH